MGRGAVTVADSKRQLWHNCHAKRPEREHSCRRDLLGDRRVEPWLIPFDLDNGRGAARPTPCAPVPNLWRTFAVLGKCARGNKHGGNCCMRAAIRFIAAGGDPSSTFFSCICLNAGWRCEIGTGAVMLERPRNRTLPRCRCDRRRRRHSHQAVYQAGEHCTQGCSPACPAVSRPHRRRLPVPSPSAAAKR